MNLIIDQKVFKKAKKIIHLSIKTIFKLK